ncbi:MAG: suppressor of fused domain protein [Polyangiaceae bacterium]|nr:suppressor of fused domain protein [Polyangiaceae bacterium]
MSDADESPGWAAIDAALKPIYGEQEPRHMAPMLPPMLGGSDPLHGISAYRSGFGGTPHWHFVTYGYTELWQKESEDPEYSGFGFEMTMRVVDASDEPPMWVFNLLQNVARYVFRTGNVFAVGHSVPANGPIHDGTDTALVAAVFAEDPQLPPISTPNGDVEFLQLVGLTQDEYDAAREWDADKLLELARPRNPALVTDEHRTSWLEQPAFRAAVEAGVEKDGSSQGVLMMTHGSFEPGPPSVLGVAASALDNLQRAMRNRLGHGRGLLLTWPEGEAGLLPEPHPDDPQGLVLSPPDREALMAIPVKRGDYSLPGGLVVRVIPVDIYDATRTHVVKVIG